jgi:hypothetical protein
MRFKVVGSKRDVMAAVFRNSDTIPIKAGSPVFLACSGTEDGLRCVSSNNLAAALQGNYFGIAYNAVAVNAFGEAQVFGFNDGVRLRVSTRAVASSDVWASYPAGGIGDQLVPITGTGTLAGSLDADQGFSNNLSQAFSVYCKVRLGQTYASQTTQASSLLSGQTASFLTVKVQVHSM